MKGVRGGGGEWLATPPTIPALSYSQTSCLPSMFSFFLGAALTESPALFPVVSARRLATAEGSARRGHFSPPSSPPTPPPPAAGVRARAQRRATAPPRPRCIFTISQLLVTVATGFHVPKVVYINPEWSLCNCRGSVVAVEQCAAVPRTEAGL